MDAILHQPQKIIQIPLLREIIKLYLIINFYGYSSVKDDIN